MSNSSYLEIVAHFIDENWELRKVMLDMPKIREISEDAEAIAEHVKNAYNENGSFKKIVCCVTDRAAVMSAAVGLLGEKHIPCFCHELNWYTAT